MEYSCKSVWLFQLETQSNKLLQICIQVTTAIIKKNWKKNWKAAVKPGTGCLPCRWNLSEFIKDSWWGAIPSLALTTCAHVLPQALLCCLQLHVCTTQNANLHRSFLTYCEWWRWYWVIFTSRKIVFSCGSKVNRPHTVWTINIRNICPL